MAFMDMFKPAPPSPGDVPTSTGGTRGNTDTPANGAPPEGKMAGSNQEPVNPLDAYAKLWDDSSKTADKAPSFTLDPKVLGDAANGMNFTQGIPQELMAKATSGDAAAMIEMMNLVGQQAYRQSLAHSSTLTDKFVSARSEYDLKGVNSKVTSALTNSALADSPNYDHPVVKAEFTRIANAIQAQSPEASPAQIAKATKEYMQNLQDAMNPDKSDSGKATAKAEAAKGTDWEQWMKS